MSAFEFRLARLQRVRAVLEKQARERATEADQRARAAEGTAETRRLEIARAEDTLRAQQSSRAIALGDVLASQRAIEDLRARRRAAVERARTLRFQADECARTWRERKRELEGLERLEERDHAGHRLEENQREARAIDEVASMRAASVARRVKHARPHSGTTPTSN